MHSDIVKIKPNIPLWLSYICLFLVNFLYVLGLQIYANTAFDGSYMQVLLYNSFAPLILSDALGIIFILLLPRLAQRLLFTVNIIMCAAIHGYLQVLGTPPTLTAVYNGLAHVGDLSVMAYISLPVMLFAGGALFTTQFFVSFVPKRSRHWRYAFCVALVLLAVQVGLHMRMPFAKALEQRQDVSAKLRSSLQQRGTIMTFFYEWQEGIHSSAEGVFSSSLAVPEHSIQALPKPHARGDVVFIQVECLGYELLDTQVQEHYVMPFLHALQESSIVLKMDGEKLLGSANSDYEILTTRKASKEFMAYDFVTDFSGNVVEGLAQQGFTTRMFHNVYGDYMNLRVTYERMGFQYRHFAENLRQAGYAPMQAWKGKIFSDADLFDYVKKYTPLDAQKTFDFIITISMHEPDYTGQDTQPFESSAHAAFYKASFDTDRALAAYYATLKRGTLLVIYGDHKAYFGEATDYVPFMVHVKGEENRYKDAHSVYTRTDMSHYLRKLLGLENH